MQEIYQQIGIKHVYGSHIVMAQKEPLDALQTFFKTYGACILQGCIVTETSPGVIDITPGLLALDHADGFKVVKYAGVTGLAASSGYFEVQRATITSTYNSGTAPGGYNYTAKFTAGGAAPDSSDKYLLVSPDNFNNKTFISQIAAKASSGWQPLAIAASGVTGSVKARVNYISRLMELQGTLTITGLTGNGVSKNILVPPLGGASAWPDVSFEVVQRQFFKAHRLYDPAALTYITEASGLDYLTDVDCYITNTVFVVMCKTPISGSLTININAVVQLD